MYAISFDMVVSDLRKHYGEPYQRAYYDISKVMISNGFEWIQGSTYLSKSHDLNKIINIINALKQIDWFCKSVRDIRGYKVEDWSNFTEQFK